MALFQKNWKQIIVSQGEPFQIEFLDRVFGKRSKVVLKVSDVDGTVTVNGTKLSGSQNFTGNLVATGNAHFSGTLLVGGATTLSTSLSVGTTLAVTGVSTFTGLAKLPSSSFLVAVTTGHNGAGAVTLTGAKIGDKVIGVANLTAPADLKSGFETTITVNDQIQQSSATDLSTTKVQVMLLHQS